MQVWNVLHAACWKYSMQKFAITRLCGAVSLQLRHVLTIGKNLLNSNIFSTCPHDMVNFSPLVAEIGSGVWGTPAIFNRFRVLPSLLHRHHSPEANQTLHNVWPSLRLVHYIIHFRRLLHPDRIFPGAKFTLWPSLAFSYITARHSSSGHEPNFVAWYKEWN